MAEHYVVRHMDDVPPVPCHCGSSRRIITRADTDKASLHVTTIQDSEPHFHKENAEYYFVLEGTGKMELDGEVFDLRPGTAVFIPAGVVHRGWGDFKTIVMAIPAYEEGNTSYPEK